MSSEIPKCPTCNQPLETERKLSIGAPPRFRWWVAPLNLFFVSLLFVSLDYASDLGFHWYIWPIFGIWGLFIVGQILKYRPEEAWLIVPFFFILLCVYLAMIDWHSGENTGIFYLDWAWYPIFTLLVLGVLLPLTTALGREKSQPVEILKELVSFEENNK